MVNKFHDIAILGGGLSGLMASATSGAPVYEARDRIGGVATSDVTDGFVFDRGIHILQTRNQKVLDLLDDIGVRFDQVERNAYIYSHGVYTAYPFQVNTARMPLNVRVRCVWNYLRRQQNGAIENYEDWMYASIGRGFAETFLIPYSEKFWTVPPARMAHEWVGNRVPQPTLLQVLRGAFVDKQTKIGTNATFQYPAGGVGYGAIADALRPRTGKINLEHRATKVDTAKRQVHFDNGEVVEYRVLVSSVPLPDLIAMATDVPDEVREAAGKLRTNSIMVVNLGVDRPTLSDRHWVHFPEKDVSFFRISYPSNFGPGLTPPGMSSISAEVAYAAGQPPDPEQLTKRVIEDLIRVRALGADDPIVVRNTFDIKYGYCIYDLDRKQAVRTVHAWLKSKDIVPTGRYGLWTYFWSDEAMLSGRSSAEKAMKYLRLSEAAE